MLATLLTLTALAAPPPLSAEANPAAPAGVRAGFGQLVGPAWSCQGSNLQTDGAWQDSPGRARWLFQYVLDGHAVQDFWYPPAESQGPPGTNLRTYDPDSDRWMMVWATSRQAHFDHFEAQVEDGHIIMTGEREASGAFPAHHVRITFSDIGQGEFHWRYEASPDGDSDHYREQARIHCQR